MVSLVSGLVEQLCAHAQRVRAPPPFYTLPVRAITMTDCAVLLLVLVAILTLPVDSVDLTVERFAAETDAVLATISRLESAQIFPSDNRLLRRIAFVETDDGQMQETALEKGGIWNVDNAQFNQTTADASLGVKRTDIATAFPEVGDWGETAWEDLSKPLWSALAARLVLFLAENSSTEGIPGASDIESQAQFWRDAYNSNGDTAKFERRVYLLIEEESKAQSSQIAKCFCVCGVSLVSGVLFP